MAGVSSAVLAVPKRQVMQEAGTETSAPGGKRAKSVQVDASGPDPHAAPASPNPALCFCVLLCDLTNGVLLRPETRELDMADDNEFVLTVESSKRNFALASDSDVENLQSATYGIFTQLPALQTEMLQLESSLTRSGFYPPLSVQGWCVFRRVQLLVFLHFWSVVTQEYNFFVSSVFLRLVGIPLRNMKTFDLLAVLHKYCYFIWLHRTESAEIWSLEALTFLLPVTMEWRQWWQQQRLAAQNTPEVAFAGEYMLMLADPLGPAGDTCVKQEVDALQQRLRRADVPVAPELPREHFWHEHDVYMKAVDALPTPRGLPCIRCTAGLCEVAWGDETGHPMNISRQASVAQTDCCLVVKVPVPSNMTLHEVLGTRSWLESFEENRLGRPFWLSGGTDAGGFSAHVSSLMRQIQLQSLGAEILATIRPDSVMHPHLRSHVEFMLGLFASVHLARGDAGEVRLLDFLLGCGIQARETPPGQGWICANYEKRHKSPASTIRPMCHTLWGEKTRPIGYPSADPGAAPILYLVHDPCPFRNCENHKQMMGFGTLCPYWHGFSKPHGNACTFAALRFLKCRRIGNKGQCTREEGVSQYLKEFLEQVGFVAPQGTTAEDADDRVLLVSLPRWLPAFQKSESPDSGPLVPLNSSRPLRHFFKRDRGECSTLQSHAVSLRSLMVEVLGCPDQ